MYRRSTMPKTAPRSCPPSAMPRTAPQQPPRAPRAYRGGSFEHLTPDRGERLNRGDDRRAAAIDEIARRSEEHTSELQSLMRISYAVFCLKKKKRKKREDTQI